MIKKIFCLIGPTASGKTELAIALKDYFPFEIVSVDSALVYKEMNIGTAKPNTAALARAPHHLIDLIDPPQAFSVAEFCSLVKEVNQSIFARGNIPLLVGGTMMYFNALQQGLSLLPTADQRIRKQLEAEGANLGWTALHKRLSNVDPLSGARINQNDSQRIQRALEVFDITGKPLSWFWQQEKEGISNKFVNLILLPEERRVLHNRIATRFTLMLKQGLIEEVQALCLKWNLNLSYPSMRTVGYKQVFQYLTQEFDFTGLCEKGIAATRQLAKRQLTWLRKWPHGLYFEMEEKELLSKILEKIRQIIDNS